MANLVVRLETVVTVDYSFWMFEDEGGAPGEVPAELSHETWMSGRRNSVYFMTPVKNQDASVTIESWDTEPVEPEGPWESSRSIRIPFDSGVLAINALHQEGDEEYLTIGGPGTYAVRALVRGRHRLVTDYPLDALPEERPPGVEQYSVQLWRVYEEP